MAAALGGVTPPTAAEEDGYFNLDRPYVQLRQVGTALLRPDDNAADCAAAQALAANSQAEIAALTDYLHGLQTQGRTIDVFLQFYLASLAGADRDSVSADLECAYDGKRPDVAALEAYVTALLDGVPPASDGAGDDLAALGAIMKRDVVLDEAVTGLEMLRDDASVKSPAGLALVARLPALQTEQQAARQTRIDRLGHYDDWPESAELFRRQVLRTDVTQP